MMAASFVYPAMAIVQGGLGAQHLAAVFVGLTLHADRARLDRARLLGLDLEPAGGGGRGLGASASCSGTSSWVKSFRFVGEKGGRVARRALAAPALRQLRRGHRRPRPRRLLRRRSRAFAAALARFSFALAARRRVSGLAARRLDRARLRRGLLLRAIGEAGWFSAANLALGALALAVARAARRAARARRGGARLPRRACRAACSASRSVARRRRRARARWRLAASWQLDWSFERRFELSPATRGALAELGRVEATLYRDPFDPRVAQHAPAAARRSRRGGAPRVSARTILDESPEDVDRFGDRARRTAWCCGAASASRRVDRPTEGTLYEALYRLRDRDARPALRRARRGRGRARARRRRGLLGPRRGARRPRATALRELVTATARGDPRRTRRGCSSLAPAARLAARGARGARAATSRAAGALVAFLEPGADERARGACSRAGASRSPDARGRRPRLGRRSAGEARGREPARLRLRGRTR